MKGQFSHQMDEVKIANFYRLQIYSIISITAFIGTIILAIIILTQNPH